MRGTWDLEQDQRKHLIHGNPKCVMQVAVEDLRV